MLGLNKIFESEKGIRAKKKPSGTSQKRIAN
jgi:hypothetical protein